MNQNLIDYIKKAKEQGISDEEIKKALLEAGWKEEDIKEAINPTLRKSKTGKKFPLKFLLVGAIIIVIVCLVGLGAYLYIKEYRQPSEEVAKEKVEEKEGEVVPENWTTYTNEGYGYQIDYPADWVIVEEAPYLAGGPSYIVRIQTFSIEELLQQACASRDDCLEVTIEIKLGITSLEEWKNKTREPYELGKESGLDWKIQEGKIQIGDKIGYEFIIWIPGSSAVVAIHRVGFFEKERLYEVEARGNNIKVLFGTFPKTSEQIFSSFRFIGEDIGKQQIERQEDISSLQKETIEFETIAERDEERVAGIMTIGVLLEGYREDKGGYPKITGCEDVWSNDLVDELLSLTIDGTPVGTKENFPKDPINSGKHVYKYNSDGTDYVLRAVFEISTSFWLESDADGNVMGCSCDDPAFCVKN